MLPSSPQSQPVLHNRRHSDPSCEKKRDSHTETRVETYSVGYESRSVYASRLDGLEDIHHTFCLQMFQLRVDDQECPTPTYPITEWEGELTYVVKQVMFVVNCHYTCT